MPSLDRRSGPGVFEPEQLTALRQLFEEACTLLGARKDSPEADDIANKVLTAFQSGYVDKETMFAALLAARKRRKSLGLGDDLPLQLKPIFAYPLRGLAFSCKESLF